MDIAPTSMLFCICCLEKGTPYIDLLNCSHTEFLNNLEMPEVKLKDQVICYQCHNMLKKIKLFRFQVEESFKLLSDKVENISKNSIKSRHFEARLLHTIDYPSTTSETNPQKSKNEIINTRENEILQTKENDIPQPRENEISQTREYEIPQTWGIEVRQTKEIEILHTKENEIPQTKENEIPQTRKNEISQTRENEIPQTRGIEVPQTREIEILHTRENEIPQTKENEIPLTMKNEIPQTRENEIPQTREHDIPQAKRRKTMTGIEGLLTEDNPETKNTENLQTIPEQAKINTENSLLPSRSQNINKNIVEALKIININQNSGCIDSLASSLQAISYSFLENILCNSNLPTVSKIKSNTNLDSMLFAINTPTTSTTTSCSENITINNTKQNNNTKLEIGRQSVYPTDKLFNNITPTTYNATAISSENVTINNTKENNNTNLEIGCQIVNPTVKLSNNSLPTTSAATSSSENVTINNATENNNTNLEIGRQRRMNPTNNSFNINIRTPIHGTNREYLDHDGGQSNTLTDISMLNKLPSSSNIRQITITREQLMKERSKLASSRAYRRYQLRCDPCLMGFEFKENLDDHVRRKHSSERLKEPVQCDVCFQLMDVSCYKKHSLSHFTRYECLACSRKFASFDDAAQHHKKHARVDKRKARIYKCPQRPKLPTIKEPHHIKTETS